MKRLTLVIGLMVVVVVAVGAFALYLPKSNITAASKNENQLITVYKSASCGCCKKWVSYLEDEGFSVKSINHDDVDMIKAENGLTDPSLKSCHTALVDGYVIEGHVPANDIERLLSERPKMVGLAAPGMPMMSPGMNSLIPQGYDVLSFSENGAATVFSSY